MPILFKAKTHYAYTLKILAELLQNNINETACFELSKDCIKLRMMDYHRTILINIVLNSHNFTLYKFKSNKKIFLGINLNHFYKMLRSIKKKDSIQLFIETDSPKDLGIRVIPKENNRITTSFLKIQEVQNLDIDIPTGYGKPVIVPSSGYQKMCKDMAHIGTTINVESKNFHIRFKCDAGGVMKRVVEFGENSDDDDDEDNEEYNQEFNTEQLSRITKISGLSSDIQIYPKNNLPLLFKSAIGSLGKIEIYIKSKDLREKEEANYDSDDDE